MAPKADPNTTPLASVGIDIGKDVFHVVAFGTDGKILFRRKIKRLSLADAFKKLPPCIVGMEACLSAHFVSRTLPIIFGLPHMHRCVRPIVSKLSFTLMGSSTTGARAVGPISAAP